MPEFEARLLKAIPLTQCNECSEIWSFRFENPLNISYEAGQFFFVTIKEESKEYRHHFSFSSSSTEKNYLEFTTKLRNTEYKNALRQLQEGDTVTIKAPYGDFTLSENIEKIGMLSGGIGITPLRSICKYCTDIKLENNIILLYSNHKEDDIAFKTDFDKMSSENANLKVVYTISELIESWKGYTGRINASLIKKEIPDYLDRIFYLSGPEGMTASLGQLLLDLKVPKDHIKKETFPRY